MDTKEILIEIRNYVQSCREEGLRYSIAFYDFETKERCDVVQANTLTIANACKKLVETETGGVFGKPIIIDNKKRRVYA